MVTDSNRVLELCGKFGSSSERPLVNVMPQLQWRIQDTENALNIGHPQRRPTPVIWNWSTPKTKICIVIGNISGGEGYPHCLEPRIQDSSARHWS